MALQCSGLLAVFPTGYICSTSFLRFAHLIFFLIKRSTKSPENNFRGVYKSRKKPYYNAYIIRQSDSTYRAINQIYAGNIELKDAMNCERTSCIFRQSMNPDICEGVRVASRDLHRRRSNSRNCCALFNRKLQMKNCP